MGLRDPYWIQLIAPLENEPWWIKKFASLIFPFDTLIQIHVLILRPPQVASKAAGWATSATWCSTEWKITQEHPASAWNAEDAWRCLETARSRRPSPTTSRPSSTPRTSPCGWASTTCAPRACTSLTTGPPSRISSGVNTSCPLSRTEGGGRTVWPCRQTTATGGTTIATGPWTLCASLMTEWIFNLIQNCIFFFNITIFLSNCWELKNTFYLITINEFILSLRLIMTNISAALTVDRLRLRGLLFVES